MGAGEAGEEADGEGDPEEDEEEEDEQEDVPPGEVGAGEEEGPGAAVLGGEEEVLDHHRHEEPVDDVAAEDGAVEVRDDAGDLAVVLGEAGPEEEAEAPAEDGEHDADERHVGRVGELAGGAG